MDKKTSSPNSNSEIIDNSTLLENKILTKKRFSQLVKKKVLKLKMDYLDAILEVCKDLDYPVEDTARVLSPTLIEKLEAEAIKFNIIKDNSTTLPI